MYYLLMAGVALSLNQIVSYIAAGLFLAVAFYNTWVLFRYPSYRKLRDQIAEEEDKRIDSMISKQVKKQAMKQVFK
jgi:hypothetical protein